MKETLVEGSIWTFDQIQGVVNVNVPVRMVVVKVSECEFKRYMMMSNDERRERNGMNC